MEAVGCYLDSVSARAFPDLLKNFRGHIDWYHIDNTIGDCAKEVQKLNLAVSPGKTIKDARSYALGKSERISCSQNLRGFQQRCDSFGRSPTFRNPSFLLDLATDTYILYFKL